MMGDHKFTVVVFFVVAIKLSDEKRADPTDLSV